MFHSLRMRISGFFSQTYFRILFLTFSIYPDFFVLVFLWEHLSASCSDIVNVIEFKREWPWNMNPIGADVQNTAVVSCATRRCNKRNNSRSLKREKKWELPRTWETCVSRFCLPSSASCFEKSRANVRGIILIRIDILSPQKRRLSPMPHCKSLKLNLQPVLR